MQKVAVFLAKLLFKTVTIEKSARRQALLKFVRELKLGAHHYSTKRAFTLGNRY